MSENNKKPSRAEAKAAVRTMLAGLETIQMKAIETPKRVVGTTSNFCWLR